MVRKVSVDPVKLYWVFKSKEVPFCNFKEWLGLKGYKLDADFIINASKKKIKKLKVRESL